MIKWSRPTPSVRNVIGRENLITSGRTNEFTHLFWTEHTHSIAKASWLAERDLATLRYITWQCSKLWWEHLERTFKNYAKLLAYLGKLTTVHLENGFQGAIKHQGSPFLVLLKYYCLKKKNCQDGLLLNAATCTVDYRSIWRGHIGNPPTLN